MINASARVGLLVLLLSANQALLAGAIYKWTDAAGRVHIGDRPPPESGAEPVSVRVNTYKNTAPEGWDSASGRTAGKVVIYTTRRCGYCRKAKAWFRSKGVAYTEYDVETSDQGRRDYKKLGGRGVPIILVGKQRLNGFSAERLAAALRKAGHAL